MIRAGTRIYQPRDSLHFYRQVHQDFRLLPDCVYHSTGGFAHRAPVGRNLAFFCSGTCPSGVPRTAKDSRSTTGVVYCLFAEGTISGTSYTQAQHAWSNTIGRANKHLEPVSPETQAVKSLSQPYRKHRATIEIILVGITAKVEEGSRARTRPSNYTNMGL